MKHLIIFCSIAFVSSNVLTQDFDDAFLESLPEEINEEYSYCQKRKGYWMLRDNKGHVVCAVTIKDGKVLATGGKGA